MMDLCRVRCVSLFFKLWKEKDIAALMDSNAGLLICLIMAAFFIYYILSRGLINFNTSAEMNIKENMVVQVPPMPGQGTDVYIPVPAAGPRKVMPSGPNPPSQQGQDGEVVVRSPPVAMDPYAEHVETADAPENLRQPERMFRPTVQNTDTMIATAGGVASPVEDTTGGAIQAFNTDFIENRGEFMSGVFANDTAPSNFGFSAF